jgi:hypothetical protein
MGYLATCQVGHFVAANSSGDDNSLMRLEIRLLRVVGHRRPHWIKSVESCDKVDQGTSRPSHGTKHGRLPVNE